MPDSQTAETFSSRLEETFRKNRALWLMGGAAVLVVLGAIIWLKQRGTSLAVLRDWTAHPAAWFVPFVFLVIALLALVILWKVPQWQVRRVKRLDAKERFDRVNEARKTLATILGGAAFLVGGFFTWQNIKVAQDAASTSQRALEVSREGQITDRFSKAIEQLGSEKLQIRLGGIYALEGIANESKELHRPIVEVLCTYVRVNAPRKPQKSDQKNQPATTPAHPDAQIHPAADIQAILTVLGRRGQKNDKESLDLSSTDIRAAHLRGAHLSGADFDGADLSGALLDAADLKRASFKEARLNRVGLIFADLSGADLRGADLKWAVLVWAHLNGADLPGADLRGAQLRYVDLIMADLSGADLRGARLTGVNPRGADLSGADLRGAHGLTQEQVDAARGNGGTQLPEGLHMPEGWKK